MVHNAIRKAVGNNWLVGIRFVVDEGTEDGIDFEEALNIAHILARLRLRPTRCIRIPIAVDSGRCEWTPLEPAGTCPVYGSLTLGGSEDPWTTGARDDNSTIGGGRTA